MPKESQPDCVPLLSFSNAILMPGVTVQVTLDGPQCFSIVGEATKNGGYIGVVQALDNLEEVDFFTTGTLARFTVTDMTKSTITVDLKGLHRFDVQEYIKSLHGFYAARVSYDRYVKSKSKSKIDRESLLGTFQKLLSYLECPDFDVGLLTGCSNENLVKELIELCPLGHVAKQHILETEALEHQSTLLRQYMEETMLGPLLEFTRQ